MNCYKIVASGNVQDVFFRASAQEIAEQLDIKGFAQNQSDGSVLIEAEGDEENIKKFIDWCRQGPPRAQVIQLNVQEEEFKNFSTFEIRR